MGKSSPSAPDPYQSAAAQYQFGTQAAEYNKALNATNEVGPTGSTTNKIIGYDPSTGAPQYQQTTSLTAPEQALLSGSQTAGLGEQGAGEQELNTLFGLNRQPTYNIGPAPTLQTTLDTSNVPQLPTGAALQDVQQGAFSTALAGEQAATNPAMAQEKEQLQAQLVNSGNGPGTPAYENAMAAEDARQANVGTQQAGAAEQVGTGLEAQRFNEAATGNQQIYGEDLNTLVAQNQAKGMSQADAITAAQAQIQQRGAVGGQAGALFAGAGVNIPSASGLPSASTSTPDIMQAFQNQYQGQLNAYNANVGTTNSLIGDAASLYGAYLLAGASDIRVKKDIDQVGETEGGLPAYLFRYHGESSDTPRHLGVMAHEAEKRFPEAVFTDHRGVKFVDYRRIA